MKRIPAAAALLLACVLLPAVTDARKGSKAIHLKVRMEPEKEESKDPKLALAEIERKIERGDLPKIQFDFDLWEVKVESYPTLDAIVNLVRRNPRVKLLVLAHTDSIGSEKYNLWLSRKRARSVKEELIKRGVPPPSVRFRGRGYGEPIADNNTEEGRAKNRRVEFRIVERWWSSVY